MRKLLLQLPPLVRVHRRRHLAREHAPIVLFFDEVEALAKVQGSPWVLVGRDGYGIGYVHESVLDAQASEPEYAANNGYGANNAYGNGGYQAASNDCRIVEQVVTTEQYNTQTQRYRACRDATGVWNFGAV